MVTRTSSQTFLTLGSEILVNTETASSQRQPSVAALSGGGFVVTWETRDQDGDGAGIYGQRYDADGAVIGPEFLVNTYTVGDQAIPSVTGLNAGGFVVTWHSAGLDGDSFGIGGQRYDAAGNAVGSEFLVNTYTNDIQALPSVTNLSGGGFVVTWISYGQGPRGNIYGQRYDAAGAAVGSEFRVNTQTVGDQNEPSVAGLPDGGFVVTWHSAGGIGNTEGIFGQRYDAAGVAVGSEFQVNTETTDNRYYPSVTALSDGGFVVTWQSGAQDGDDLLYSGQGRDNLDGGSGHDELLGRRGDDTLHGGRGQDTLKGGSGDDLLTGSFGADRFVFGQNVGNDTITDFDYGSDTIEITRGAEALNEITFAQSGDDVLITFAETSVLVENIAVDDLNLAENFLFT